MDDVHRILWVDDEPTQVMSKIQFLEDYGFEVTPATSVIECKEKLSVQQYDLVIIDMMIPNTGDIDFIRAKGGLTTGLELARWIRKEHPDQKIVGCSISDEEAASVWFRMHASGFWLKGDLRPSHSLINKVQVALNGGMIDPKIFIVHGHNDVLTLQLKNYLQNVLLIGEPVILREQPTFGRTLIEKFEDVADNSDLVFVLLTPDDYVYDPETPVGPIRRARQNVIFELGYFYGKIGRRSGRIILLYQGVLDIPSDISGLVYINVDNGIDAAGEDIRRELRYWLDQPKNKS